VRDNYRSSFGIVETAGKAATVHVTLYAYASTTNTASVPIGERSYSIAAHEHRFFSDLTREMLGPHRDDYYDDLHDVHIAFQVIDGDGAVIPYVVTTESATGDRLVRSGPF
jgi:hypothetical protein